MTAELGQFVAQLLGLDTPAKQINHTRKDSIHIGGVVVPRTKFHRDRSNGLKPKTNLAAEL